uniref:Uncharacterized protein n=1 Tax=Ciona intestinalis TaxID=7719 RepID=F7BDC4_CIOIN
MKQRCMSFTQLFVVVFLLFEATTLIRGEANTDSKSLTPQFFIFNSTYEEYKYMFSGFLRVIENLKAGTPVDSSNYI